MVKAVFMNIKIEAYSFISIITLEAVTVNVSTCAGTSKLTAVSVSIDGDCDADFFKTFSSVKIK